MYRTLLKHLVFVFPPLIVGAVFFLELIIRFVYSLNLNGSITAMIIGGCGGLFIYPFWLQLPEELRTEIMRKLYDKE